MQIDLSVHGLHARLLHVKACECVLRHAARHQLGTELMVCGFYLVC